MSIELAKEAAANAWYVLQDLVRHDPRMPNTIHISRELEMLLIAHFQLNCNYHFPDGKGVRGMSHINGLCPVWDAPFVRLEFVPWNKQNEKLEATITTASSTEQATDIQAGISLIGPG